MRRYFFVLCCFLLWCGEASAARTFSFSVYMNGSRTYPLDPITCLPIAVGLKVNYWISKVENLGCSESDVNDAIKRGGGTVIVTNKDGDYTIAVSISKTGGDCLKGRAAGPASVPIAYVDKDNIDKVLQVIRDPMTLKGSQGACEISATEVGGCFMYTASQPALKECTVYFSETGAETGADSAIDSSTPAYTGGTGDTGGGGTTPGGGGTTPGGGGTTPGGGGTSPGGGGTTPGGGGTTPGGGGTTPGDGGTTPGGGGTSPGGGGTGGGGTGDTQANCGAPGQPACSINEGNTPTGIGGLMDGLMKLVDGLGEGRQSGIDDAKSDAGKNTSLTNFSVNLPTGVCTNPTVSLPNMSRTYTVDVCQYVGILRAAFDALWAFAFVVGVVSLVGRATAKPVA